MIYLYNNIILGPLRERQLIDDTNTSKIKNKLKIRNISKIKKRLEKYVLLLLEEKTNAYIEQRLAVVNL